MKYFVQEAYRNGTKFQIMSCIEFWESNHEHCSCKSSWPIMCNPASLSWDPDYLLWARLISDEDLIPQIQSRKGNYKNNEFNKSFLSVPQNQSCLFVISLGRYISCDQCQYWSVCIGLQKCVRYLLVPPSTRLNSAVTISVPNTFRPL